MGATAVGELRALRSTGRAARVEDAGVVVRIDRGAGKRAFGLEDVAPRGHVGGRIRESDPDDRRVGEVVPDLREAIESLLVRDDHSNAYRISSPTHHAFMPITRTPVAAQAQ